MPNEIALAFAQSVRWIIAGVAGAAFAKIDLLDRGFWYQVGFIGPLILALTMLEYMVLVLIEAP